MTNTFQCLIWGNVTYFYWFRKTFIFYWLFGWLVGFYGISTFVGYLTPNPIFMQIVLFQTIQFSMSTQFNCQNISISSYSVYSNNSNSIDSVSYKYRFCLHTVKSQNSQNIKQFSLVKVEFQCQKTVPFQTFQLNISPQFKSKYSLIVKTISISSYSV